MIAAQRNRSVTGVMMLLAAVTMLFAAFTSAMIVRRGLSGDWITTPLPRILWVNTVMLAASSLLLLRKGGADSQSAAPALAPASRVETSLDPAGKCACATICHAEILGILFLCGQIEAWRELAAAGIYLPTNPSASFFYILTVTHFVHVLGGLFALQFANRQAAAVYWHFMTGLWIYVLLLFSIWG